MHETLKQLVRVLLEEGARPSFLAIHHEMDGLGYHVGARHVAELLREVELEYEAEMWSILCLP